MNPKNRQQTLIIVAAVAVGLFIANSIILTPLYNVWKSRGDKIEALRKKVNDGVLLIKNEQSTRRRWAEMQASTLTNDQTIAEQQVHKAFDQWSKSSGVRLISLVSPPWKKDNSGEYMTLDCRVEASGNLHNVKNFIQQVEQDPMALREQTVELSSKDNSGQQIIVGLQLSALVLTPKKPNS